MRSAGSDPNTRQRHHFVLPEIGCHSAASLSGILGAQHSHRLNKMVNSCVNGQKAVEALNVAVVVAAAR